MNVTLTRVADEHHEYDTSYGRKAAFKVWMDDGKTGEVTTNLDTLGARRLQFEAFIGKPTELIVEDGGKWPDGNPKPLKVKIPQQQSFAPANTSSKKDYTPRYQDTETGWREADERIDRRRSLELAVQLRGPEQADWMVTADRMYKWLRGPLDVAASNPSQGAATGEPRTKANTGTSRDVETPSADVTASASPDSWGAAAVALGEGSPAAVSPPLPMDEPQLKATDEQWDRLRAVVGGSQVKAVNRLNRVNKTDYTQATAAEGATRAEVAAAITGEVL